MRKTHLRWFEHVHGSPLDALVHHIANIDFRTEIKREGEGKYLKCIFFFNVLKRTGKRLSEKHDCT